MAEKEASRIFQQILSALIYLKRMGVSHRDIKP
jgi:serine/threonine protein kinase